MFSFTRQPTVGLPVSPEHMRVVSIEGFLPERETDV